MATPQPTTTASVVGVPRVDVPLDVHSPVVLEYLKSLEDASACRKRQSEEMRPFKQRCTECRENVHVWMREHQLQRYNVPVPASEAHQYGKPCSIVVRTRANIERWTDATLKKGLTEYLTAVHSLPHAEAESRMEHIFTFMDSRRKRVVKDYIARDTRSTGEPRKKRKRTAATAGEDDTADMSDDE